MIDLRKMLIGTVILLSVSTPTVAVAMNAPIKNLPVKNSYNVNTYEASDVNVLYYYDYLHPNKPKEVKHNINYNRQPNNTDNNTDSNKSNTAVTNNANTNTYNEHVTQQPVGRLRLSIVNDSKQTMIRKINDFLASTPMRGHGVDFVNAGIEYNVDPYFIAAITMQESTGGQFVGAHCNAWGRKALGGGWMSFPSWTAGIYNETQYIANNYLNEGLDSINSISYKYCPTPRGQWEAGITGFQEQIANE